MSASGKDKSSSQRGRLGDLLGSPACSTSCRFVMSPDIKTAS